MTAYRDGILAGMHGAVVLDPYTGRPEGEPGAHAPARTRRRLSGSPAGREILRMLDRAVDDPHEALDPFANFAYSAVQAGSTIIGSAATPKTLIVATGDGTAFGVGDGVTQFNVVVWPTNTRPLRTNAEIMRVTRSGDTLTTVARAQEGTSALAGIAAGYQVMEAVTVKSYRDLGFGGQDGADQASAATVTLSEPFTGITGTVTIANLALASSLTARKGMRVTLYFEAGPIVVQNNGGGTGNILTLSGSDATFLANSIVTFRNIDGTHWLLEGSAGGAITATTVAGLGTGTQGKLGWLRLMPATYNNGGSTALPAGTITVGDTSELPSAGTVLCGAAGFNGTVTYTGKTATTLTGCTGGTGTLAANAPVVLASGTPVNSSYETVMLVYDATIGKWVSRVDTWFGGQNGVPGPNTASTTFAELFGNAATVAASKIGWRAYDAAGLKPQLRMVGQALQSTSGDTVTIAPSFDGCNNNVSAVNGPRNHNGADTAAAVTTAPAGANSWMMPFYTLWGNLPGGYTLYDVFQAGAQAKVNAGAGTLEAWQWEVRWVG